MIFPYPVVFPCPVVLRTALTELHSVGIMRDRQFVAVQPAVLAFTIQLLSVGWCHPEEASSCEQAPIGQNKLGEFWVCSCFFIVFYGISGVAIIQNGLLNDS